MHHYTGKTLVANNVLPKDPFCQQPTPGGAGSVLDARTAAREPLYSTLVRLPHRKNVLV
ncbi:MAG: hypothetical protein ACLT98_10655 [Eggerthellaceae bacterium]